VGNQRVGSKELVRLKDERQATFLNDVFRKQILGVDVR